MKQKGAMIFWIDETFDIQSEFIPSYQLKEGATYSSEANWITGHAEHVVILLSDRLGIPHEMERVEQLKSKAMELKQKSSNQGA